MKPELSIIVPAYNAASFLESCLAAILQAPGPEREIIVVDDASQDDSSKSASAFGVRVIRNDRNLGCAESRNIGAREARSPILIFIDADCVIHHDALNRIDSFFAKNQSYAALFGSYDSTPECRTFISQYRNLLHHLTHQNARRDAETFWTGLGAVRRTNFERLGGFRQDCGMEDVLLGIQLNESGCRVAIDKNLLCKHLKCWSFINMIRTDIFLRAQPWSQIALSRRHFANDLNTSVSNRIGVLSSGISVVLMPLAFLNSTFAYALILFLAINIASNAHVLSGFMRLRGPFFAMRAIPAHFVHQLCAGLGLCLALLESMRGNRFSYVESSTE